ncbi:ankyrin repeat domain-containing protein [Gemmatimonas sp.]|jgi:ankyrin repeat protein|uniref:ankyrin repeat domain-containing protein n=1 Tax=Gemmatimonas sp. TaxID=1962908 RepID=UPI0037C191E6
MVRTAPDALLTAIRSKDRDTITAMLAADPSLVLARAPGGEPLVLHACYMGASELADLLHMGRPFDACEAAALGDVHALRTCLENDDDSRVRRSSDGWTPLHLAAFFGRDDAVTLLIDHGAPLDAHSTNALRNSPLHAALAGNTLPVLVRRLVFAGADVTARDAHGNTPLHLAASRGYEPLCDLLLARGADAHAISDDKSTPAMLAIARGFPELGAKLAAVSDDLEPNG